MRIHCEHENYEQFVNFCAIDDVYHIHLIEIKRNSQMKDEQTRANK